MGYQKIIVIGNLGRDAEVRFSQAGKPVANFSIAVNEGKGEYASTEWFNVVAFGKAAESAGEWLKKGKEVGVEGKLKTREYDDKKTGEKRKAQELICDRWFFVGGKREDGASAGEPGDERTTTRRDTPVRRDAPTTPRGPGDEDIPF